MPKISVVMPVYNGEKYLPEAIDSILKQTYRDFELLIINDGSTDGSPQILEEYQKADSRIRLYHQPNSGLVKTLNLGIDLAWGDYIARMDQDDISLPDRLRSEFDLLESQPEIGIVGTACSVIDEIGNILSFTSLPETDLEIRWNLLLKSAFVHSSVMLRKKVLVQNNIHYDNQIWGEDFDLWIRLLDITNGANINQPFILYRIHRTNSSNYHVEEHLLNVAKIAHKNISRNFQGHSLSVDDTACLNLLTRYGRHLDDKKIFSKRAVYAAKYLELWSLFKKKYCDRPMIHIMERLVLKRACKWTFYPFPQNKFFSALKELGKIDRFWLFKILFSAR
jgi:glycosyltransferase involved in cell wall biosynthesis